MCDSIKKKCSSPIFLLNIDCFDEIFDYLSLRDVQSFGQTCKTFHQTAGNYYHRNFKSSEKFLSYNGIYTVYSDHEGIINQRIQTHFNEFINYFSHYYEDLRPLEYIHLNHNEFNILSHIYLVCLEINQIKINYLQPVLRKITTLQLRQCTLNGTFYETVLINCKNLRSLYVQDDLGDIVDEFENPWMLRPYPKLEYFQLTTRYPFKIHELTTFFRVNPNIRRFSTSSRCLWENRRDLMKSNIQLEELEIHDNFFRNIIDIGKIRDLLNELHRRGFYQRLKLFVNRMDRKTNENVMVLQGLEGLATRQITDCIGLGELTHLKELTILDGVTGHFAKIIAQKFINIERVFVKNANLRDILPFIQYSRNVTKIKVFFKNNLTLNLQTLNDERRKLVNANKITIYTADSVFLATKWKTNCCLDMIEVKRADSFDWEHHY